MRALCNREGLLTAFGMVSGVVPVRSPKPILQNVKLVTDADEGSMLMATDLEVGIRHRVLGMKVKQPGAVILPTAEDRIDFTDQRRHRAGNRDRGRAALRTRACRPSSPCRAKMRARFPKFPTSPRQVTMSWPLQT